MVGSFALLPRAAPNILRLVESVSLGNGIDLHHHLLHFGMGLVDKAFLQYLLLVIHKHIFLAFRIPHYVAM